MIDCDCICDGFPESEWVSVEEEVPPCHGQVLIYCEDGHFVYWKYVMIDEEDEEIDVEDYPLLRPMNAGVQ